MKCSKCGFENKDKAKFCTKCGNSLTANGSQTAETKSNNSKYIIIALIVIIILLVATIGYFAISNQAESVQSNENTQESTASQEVQSTDNDGDEAEQSQTQSVSSSKSSTQVVNEKSWESIGVYSGSGSGSQTINVPAGKIMVKLSAYPIKNYATNHLYVTGSNGMSGGVDWGSKSDVETRSDSFTYTSSSDEIFTIDYYETVNWEVEFFIYR